jgi:hypothetical protein
MRPFGWTSPDGLAEIAAMSFGTVADAMIAPPGASRANGDLLKAGGLDLLDLTCERAYGIFEGWREGFL